jgi:hypothetical protein
MARKTEFNFGANRKPRKSKGGKKSKGKGGKGRGNAWRNYVGSSAPIPD